MVKKTDHDIHTQRYHGLMILVSLSYSRQQYTCSPYIENEHAIVTPEHQKNEGKYFHDIKRN